MKDLLKELQDRLEQEMASLKTAREQKNEMSEMLAKSNEKKKQMQAELSEATEKADKAQSALEKERRSIAIKDGHIADQMNTIDQMTAQVNELNYLIKKGKEESAETIKQRDIFKKLVDEINEKFGGMNAVDEAIRLARLKEESVAGLLSRLETVMESTESNLSCMKCMQIL